MDRRKYPCVYCKAPVFFALYRAQEDSCPGDNMCMLRDWSLITGRGGGLQNGRGGGM